MHLIEALLQRVDDGVVEDVRMGAFWTAVVIRQGGARRDDAQHDAARRCGLASTLHDAERQHSSGPAVAEAGKLIGRSGLEVAQMARSSRVMEASIGLATLNALLTPPPGSYEEGNAEEVLARLGAGRQVALVGHFPFVDSLRPRVGALHVLELRPQGADLPAESAPDVIPQADVLAITATTLLNGTFDGLMALRRADAPVMLLGPSTPLSPLLFDYGIRLLSGALVEQIEPVLAAVSQGANFRQVHHAGVRLVTLQA